MQDQTRRELKCDPEMKRYSEDHITGFFNEHEPLVAKCSIHAEKMRGTHSIHVTLCLQRVNFETGGWFIKANTTCGTNCTVEACR
jgi:hypothetical protein